MNHRTYRDRCRRSISYRTVENIQWFVQIYYYMFESMFAIGITNDASRLLYAFDGYFGCWCSMCAWVLCICILLIHSVYIDSATAIYSCETSNSNAQMLSTMIFPVDEVNIYECEDMSNGGIAHTTRYFVCLVARLLMLLNRFRRIGAHFVSGFCYAHTRHQYVARWYIYIYTTYTMDQHYCTAVSYSIVIRIPIRHAGLSLDLYAAAVVMGLFILYSTWNL